MDRIEIIHKLLHAHTLSTTATESFLEKPRKYTEDDNLFMREVHFAIEVGSSNQLTMSELAQRLNVTQGAVTQMANRMEKKGYVFRSKSDKDKRVTTISLTDKGKELRKNHMDYDNNEYILVSKLLNDFSDEELLKIIKYETIICGLFTNHL